VLLRCALIWLAGSPAVGGPQSHIGFHAASVGKTISSKGNAVIGAYLRDLGLNYNAISSPSPFHRPWNG
jgi:hypothetical protein